MRFSYDYNVRLLQRIDYLRTTQRTPSRTRGIALLTIVVLLGQVVLVESSTAQQRTYQEAHPSKQDEAGKQAVEAGFPTYYGQPSTEGGARSHAGKQTAAAAGKAEITVSSPNGGEIWQVGRREKMEWSAQSVSGDVFIRLYRGNNELVRSIYRSPANDGSATWTLPPYIEPGDNYYIRILSANDEDIYDQSDRHFSIISGSGPYIEVTYPEDGEILRAGEQVTVTWASQEVAGNVEIKLLQPGAEQVFHITQGTRNSGSYTWAIPSDLDSSDDYYISIASVEDQSVWDTGGRFTIEAPSSHLTMVHPNSGETWRVGREETIEWSGQGITGRVDMDLYRGDGVFVHALYVDSRSNGSLTWTVTPDVDPGNDYYIRISSVDDPDIYDFSERFTIEAGSGPFITVMCPASGLMWNVGHRATIEWNSARATGPVQIKLYSPGANLVNDIAPSTENDGAYEWKVPDNLELRNDYYVVITSQDNTSVWDATNYFTVAHLAVTYPNGGEEWTAGASQAVEWASANVLGQVRVELYQGDAEFVRTVAAETDNDGHYMWDLPDSVSPDGGYYIAIRSTDDLAFGDVSDGYFNIVTGVSVVALDGGVPVMFALAQNYPNPFNPATTITYDVAEPSDVRVLVHDLLGKAVAVLVDEHHAAGRYEVTFDAGGLSSGAYLYTLRAGDFTQTRRLVLLK